MRVMPRQLSYLICLCAMVACGGTSTTRRPKPKSLPSGGNYEAVWFSPQFGELNLIRSATRLVGTYKKDERFGRVRGKPTGNLFRYTWEEQRELVGGKPVTLKGHGYFEYLTGDDGRHYLVGRWGNGERDDDGGEWRAYKLEGRKPSLGTPDAPDSHAFGTPLEERDAPGPGESIVDEFLLPQPE